MHTDALWADTRALALGNIALGSENKNLPGYVLLHAGAVPPGGLENFSNGFLPATYQALMQADGKRSSISTRPIKTRGFSAPKLDVLLQQDRQFLQSREPDDAIDSPFEINEMAYKMQSVVPERSRSGKESEATSASTG